MKHGNWIPMDKTLMTALPVNRAYNVIEAAYSYQLDLDNGTVKSLSEYARIWRWSRTKVTNFIRKCKVTHTDNPKASQRPIRFRFVNTIQHVRDRADTTQEPTKSRPETATINPNPNKHINTFDFEQIWQRYPLKDGKRKAKSHFLHSVITDRDWRDINRALDNYLKHLQVETWKKPKNGSTWFNNWKDWIDWQEPRRHISDWRE